MKQQTKTALLVTLTDKNFCIKYNYANIKKPTIIRRALRLNELLIFKAMHHVL